MNSVLVTGGTGFIGSHTCISLLENGYKIIIIDSYINSTYSVLEKIKRIIQKKSSQIDHEIICYQGDIRDEELLKKIFSNAIKNNCPINAVIHFAGLKSMSESIKTPIKYWDSNVCGSVTLFKIMDSFACNTLIFSSSASIYDSSDSNLLTESAKIKPINPYGYTKATIESILFGLFESTKKWKIINLRYFNPVGAHSSGLIGELPLGKPNNLFPLMMKVASKEISELEIYGVDWPTKDGTPIRDYIHVMDLAHAHVYALDYLMENNNQIINLNLGTGKGTSVLEFIKVFERVNNVSIPFVFSSRRDGDKAKLIADNKKMINLFKWEPKRNIEDICKDGWNWKLKNKNGFQT